MAYFNFETNPKLNETFEENISPDYLIPILSHIAGQTIVKEKTLIVFDEVQLCERALTSLKYFCEDTPDIHIIVAGSLLGISLHSGFSYPVGKVEELRLYPMNFLEFLGAMGKRQLVSILTDANWNVVNMLETELTSLLRQYYYVGGMPAAVLAHVRQKGLQEVRSIQTQILLDYRRDFSKHAPGREVPRVNMVWDSIPAQLAKENKKFVYGLVREGARAKDYETAILWLSDCGLVHKISRVNAGGIPLKAYEDLKAFKLFLVDVGLLGCMAGLRQRTLLDGNVLFIEFKGALTEQYVCQQLKTIEDLGVYYYTNDRGSCEIDFIVDAGEQVIPVEVKAETNLRAKSLKTYQEKFTPEIAVRTSMADFKKEDRLVNLPLYAVEQIAEL